MTLTIRGSSIAGGSRSCWDVHAGLVAAVAGILQAKGQLSLPAAVVAPGPMVLAIILFMESPAAHPAA